MKLSALMQQMMRERVPQGVQPDHRFQAFLKKEADTSQDDFDFNGVDSIGSRGSDPYTKHESASKTFTANSNTSKNITLKQTVDGFKISIHETTEVPDDGVTVFLSDVELQKMKRLLDELSSHI